MAKKLSIALPPDVIEEEQSENLSEIRNRIQRAINDPRPAFTGKHVRDTLYAKHAVSNSRLLFAGSVDRY